MTHPVKVANLGMFLLPLLFLPASAPLVLMNTSANVGVNLLSESLVHTSYMLYYLSPSIPFVFNAVIKGWPRVVRVAHKWSVRSEERVSSSLILAVLSGLFVANVFLAHRPFRCNSGSWT